MSERKHSDKNRRNQRNRRRRSPRRSSSLSNSKLKLVCTVLDLEKKGTHSDLIHRILGFLLSPKNSGKVSPDRLSV